MGINQLRKVSKDQGFTIVELLIVIVVIAILATITIVAYNGVQARAKLAAAADDASKVQQVAESINNDVGSYPRLTADWTAAANVTAKLPAAISLVYTTTPPAINQGPNAGNATTTVLYQYCGAIAAPLAGAATGGRIQFWDSVTGAMSTTILYVGTGSAAGGAGASPCHTWVTPAS